MTDFLVTGATGFIGRHLIARLLAAGHSVRALARSTAGLRADGPGALTPFPADLADLAALHGACDGVAVVVNLAGALGRRGVSRAELDAVNVQGALNLAAEARRAGVRHFLHVSAGGVSGPTPQGGGLMDETSPCRPQTDYEASKLAGERALLAEARRGLPLTIARVTFTYGPADRHKLPLFRAIARGRFFLVNGGRSRLHPVYVADLVEGLLLAARADPRGRVYLLGGPRPLAGREIALTIAAALSAPPPRLSLPAALLALAVALLEPPARALGIEPPLTRSRLAQWRDDYAYDITRARVELGYNPRTDFAAGVAATVADYRARGWL
ncbi:MAG: NAD-dependent epimerase/dehydratase family protein [Chloroflexi bacterium]|nr:NAD-dependent epimerase/dehydratase family protein [Chloroflexota bacterium]